MTNVSLLWQQYTEHKSVEAKNKLIETYSRLVHVIVGRICTGDKYGIFEKDDLYSYGIIGLIEAIERFNPKHGVKFETFATLRIRGHIIDTLRKSNWLPKEIKKSIMELEAAAEQLAAAGLSVSDEKLMEVLNMDKAKLDKILRYANQSNLIYLDNFIPGESDDRFIDNVADNQLDPLDSIIIKQTTIELSESIKKLSEKEQMVLSLYYYEELTLKEIAIILNLSEARISQIHTKIIQKLRGFLTQYKKAK